MGAAGELDGTVGAGDELGGDAGDDGSGSGSDGSEGSGSGSVTGGSGSGSTSSSGSSGSAGAVELAAADLTGVATAEGEAARSGLTVVTVDGSEASCTTADAARGETAAAAPDDVGPRRAGARTTAVVIAVPTSATANRSDRKDAPRGWIGTCRRTGTYRDTRRAISYPPDSVPGAPPRVARSEVSPHTQLRGL